MSNAYQQTYQDIDCGGGTKATITAYDPTLFGRIAENERLTPLSGEALVEAILEEYPTQVLRVQFRNPKQKERGANSINNKTDGVCTVSFDENGIVTEVQREYSDGHANRDSNIEKIYSANFYYKEKDRVFKAIATEDPEKITAELSKYTDTRILYFMQDALGEKNNPTFFLLQKEMEKRNGYIPVDAETVMETKYVPDGDFKFTKIRTIFNFQSQRVFEKFGESPEHVIPFDEFNQQALEDMRKKLIDLGGTPREIGMQKKPQPVLGGDLKK